MNTTLASGTALASAIAADLAAQPAAQSIDVAVCPPFPYLIPVRAALGSSTVALGAQNAYFEKPGAFTGETGLDMLKDVGCRWVIIGHSERRQFFGDTDELISRKIQAAHAAGLGVIFCVGELLADREGGRTEAVLETQLKGGLAQTTAEQCANLVIAYEPVWAIGTGKTASPAQAEAAHAYIRNWLAARYNRAVADQLRIQYGGSVKPDNAAELLAQPNVDGALVGGAALKPEQFLPILHAAISLVGKKA